MMRRLALALMLLATPALAQSRAAPKSFTQDDLKRAEAARDSAVARLRTLEARSSAAARDLGDIDADLIAAAADSTAREEAAYAAEEQLMILADETQTASSSLSADQAALDDLLAALMTFGSRRPPALATSPEDSAAAVRAAILMSDAAPALSRRATELKSQIETLNRLAAETRAQQTNLASATGALAARREEIAALAEEKRRASATLDAETAAARAEPADGSPCTVSVWEQPDRDPAHWTRGTFDTGEDGTIDDEFTMTYDAHFLPLVMAWNSFDGTALAPWQRDTSTREADGTETRYTIERLRGPASTYVETFAFTCAAARPTPPRAGRSIVDRPARPLALVRRDPTRM